MGFGFLAVVIGYLPVLYQAFSRREIAISLLDARAGSPPSAGAVAAAAGPRGAGPPAPRRSWSSGSAGRPSCWRATVLPGAELLPLAARQPVVAGGPDRRPRHLRPAADRRPGRPSLPGPADVRHGPARGRGPGAGVPDAAPAAGPPTACRRNGCGGCGTRCGKRGAGGARGAGGDARLAELRGLYEPFVNALARVPAVRPAAVPAGREPVDNWQTSAWMRRAAGIGQPAGPRRPRRPRRMISACGDVGFLRFTGAAGVARGRANTCNESLAVAQTARPRACTGGPPLLRTGLPLPDPE